MAAIVNAEVIYDYVEDIDPNLTCSICQSALVDPVTTTSCKHTFCRDCITTALTHQPQCPIDRSALTVHSLQDTEMLVKLMLDELKVKCAAEECGEVMQRGLLLGHSRECKKVVVGCGNADCGLRVKREKLAHHRAYECFQRQMECQTCQVKLTFKHRLQHSADGCNTDEDVCPHCDEILPMSNRPRFHAWTCPKAPVPCIHTTRGCSFIVPRESLSAHLQTCPFEALASFFEMNDARHKAIENRANSLESSVRGLRIELAATKADLADARHTLAYLKGRVRDTWVQRGPPSNLPFSEDDPIFADSFPQSMAMGQPTSVAAAHAASQPERVLEDPTTPQNGRIEVDLVTPRSSIDRPVRPSLSPPVENAPPAPVASISPGSPPSPPRPVASSFVGAVRPGITDRAAADIHAAQTQPHGFALQNFLSWNGDETRQSYADEVFERLPVGLPPDRAIPTLLRMTAQLALGMDRIERRSQTRTMTESLRIQEEVASLRGIVNTMRMQVMMDRPNGFRPMPQPTPSAFHSSSPPADRSDALFSAPFSSYAPTFLTRRISPSVQPIPPSLDADTSEVMRGTGPLIMLQQSINRASVSSTSSLVSTGVRAIGRPMGIPPDTESVPRIFRRANPISALGRRLTQRDRDRDSGPRL